MTVVIKKDGSKENFRSEKIRKGIENAARRADVDKKRAKEIASKVAREVADSFRDRDEVRSRDIRDRVVRDLDREEKKLAREFKSFSKD